MVERVVHCKRAPYNILIDRTTPYGNPFIIGRDGTRAEVIKKYRDWAPQQPWFHTLIRHIKGQAMVVGCWCAPQPCHGDVLIEFSEAD